MLLEELIKLLRQTTPFPPDIEGILVWKIDDLNCLFRINPQGWLVCVLNGRVYVSNASAPPPNLICAATEEIWILPSHETGISTFTCFFRASELEEYFSGVNVQFLSHEEFLDWKEKNYSGDERLLIQHYLNYFYVEKQLFNLLVLPSSSTQRQAKALGKRARAPASQRLRRSWQSRTKRSIFGKMFF